MCGIIGYVGNRRAAPIIWDALKHLEYRGYDSAGIATISGSLKLIKDQGKLAEIAEKHDFGAIEGKIGIGHTRWATHGPPSQVNAHPHTDCTDSIAVIHNGIIENYVSLKEELKAKGHKFKSQTDTEVVAHLIEDFGGSLEDAFKQAVKRIEGSFALVVLDAREPDKILIARNFSPLVLGVGKDEYFAASDIPAFLHRTNKVVYVQDGQYGVLSKDGIQLKDISDGKEVEYDVHEITWSSEMAEKGGYEHFTLKEIHEQPEAIAETLRSEQDVEKVANALLKMKRFYVVACGTSYNAGLATKYLFEKFLGIPVEPVIASEFMQSVGHVVDGTCGVLAISQSGETADTLAAIRLAKKKGAKTFAITNVVGSSITRECDFSVYTHAGPEIGVVATKTFVTQLVIIYLLVSKMAKRLGKPTDYTTALRKTPELIERILRDTEGELDKIAKKYYKCHDFYFLGRGISFPAAAEGALKLKEISYAHAEGFAAGELKHGPLALISAGTPVFVLAPKDATYSKTLGNMQEVLARGADVIALVGEGDDHIRKASKHVFVLPMLDEYMSPISFIVPLQLLAYKIAVLRGLDPDKPRNLAKSVTVE